MKLGSLAVHVGDGRRWTWLRGTPVRQMAVVVTPKRRFFGARIQATDPGMPGLGAIVTNSVVLGSPVALIEGLSGRRYKVYNRIVLLGGEFSGDPKIVYWNQLPKDMRTEVIYTLMGIE